MEESIFELITELCSGYVEEAICCHPSIKKTIVTKLRSQAYEILLSHRNQSTEDELENNPTLLLTSILDLVYGKAKSKGCWTKDVMDEVCQLIDGAEILAGTNSSFVSVLKLLLCLADLTSTSGADHHQELSHGSSMKIVISDNGFKHKPLINSESPLNPKIFEVPSFGGSLQSREVFNEKPGTGLKYQHCFGSLITSSSVESGKFEDDINNGNWIHPKLNDMTIPVTSDPRASMHQDEGYVTPDQDLIQNQCTMLYIPWEDFCETDFNSVYSWESFGSSVVTKEPKFISQSRDSVQPIGRVIHASDATSLSSRSDLTALKTICPEELEVAFKNLLIGVESTIFQYDKAMNSFVLQKGLCLEGTMANTLEEYCADFIECGNRFWQLTEVTTEGSIKDGLVFQMLCNSIRQYLQCYRGVVLKMPPVLSLLATRDWLYKLSSQMQFLISLCPMNSDRKSKELLIYLCDKMPVTYRHDLAYIYYYVLQSCFTVYFTFLSKWIFEGVTDGMWESEFFIRCNPLTENMYNRKFWTEGFKLEPELVPSCLKGLESRLLSCGKSMALLKLCAKEDPVCKQVKNEHPEIVYCFNKADLRRVEEKFDLYKKDCKAHCQELFGNAMPEPHNEGYYAGLMAKTLDEIKGRQEKERRLKAEKKQMEFNVLKKEMEDAKARKTEEKRILLEEEEKLMKEAEKIDQLNDLRRQEEREKIMQLYTSLSDAADRRRDKAEWIMKRAELHDKRCTFWSKENEWLEEEIKLNTDASKIQQTEEESKLQLVDESLEKYLKTYSAISGSGDYVISNEDNSLQESNKRTYELFGNEQSKQLMQGDQGDENLELIKSEKDDKRDWLIALDVAEQARQSALKFKQRNMHNDYNIITGEETTYENKFGEKHTEGANEEAILCDIIEPAFNGSNKDLGFPFIEPGTSTSGVDLNERTGDEKQNDSQSHHSSNQLLSPISTKLDITIDEPETRVTAPANTSFTSVQSDCESNIQEIDMTSVYQNVQKSVMIPLMVQLELTSDAILRLFNKHNLFHHIECISKYFFLLEGEFARNITKNIFAEAQKGQHPSCLLNVIKLNSLLRCAVGTNVDEEYTERLSFCVKEIPSVFRTIDPAMMDCLSLSYKTHWPINIIISDEQIEKQDKIFKHLLKLHRVSWALEETIYLLKDKRLLNSEEYRKVQLFRHVMAHFVTSIRQSITSVVVELTWGEFKNQFESATTVDMIYDAYRTYVKNVNSRCLLGKARPHTEHHFTDLYKQVLKFYETLRSGEWIQDTNGSYRHTHFSRLNHAFDNFKRTADHLMYIFLKMSNTYPYTKHLATTLSLNDFYMCKVREFHL